jgi:DNA-binding response OmpR family regulator
VSDDGDQVTGRVLVVDDDASIRRLLQVALEAEGLEVETARNGAEAVQAALVEPPVAILLDVMMPVLDGWGAAQQLAANRRTARVPIVFLSARTLDSDLARGRELGAVAYVTKPFDLADLCELVHTLVDDSVAVSA